MLSLDYPRRRRASGWTWALIVAALVIGVLASCSRAGAREPLPSLEREFAQLDRALPVLLEAERTANAARVAMIHGGIGR